MGLRGANSILFTITGLTLKALKEISRSRLPEDQRLVCIDVDCSWVGHKLAAKTGNYHQAGEMTAEVLYLFSQAGFVVTPICDPQDRHHSKRASTARIAEKEKAWLTALCARYRLTALSQKLLSTTTTADEKEEDEKEIASLNKVVKKAEKKASTSGTLPSSFVEDLELALAAMDAHLTNEHECLVQKVEVAFSQADALIAKRSVEGKSHLILANDTDFLTLVGGECLTIRDFNMKRGRGNKRTDMAIGDFSVACCNLGTYTSTLNAMSLPERQKIKKKNKPKFPLFDGRSARFRATIAVIMGSDVLIGGIKDIGATKINKKIEEYEKNRAANRDDSAGDDEALRIFIVEWVCAASKMSKAVFEAFVDAFIFEPANTKESVDKNNEAFVYVHGTPPTSLPRYLKDFCVRDEEGGEAGPTRVIDGPDTCVCVGPLGVSGTQDRPASHLVFKEESVEKCKICNALVCMTCRMQHKLATSADGDNGNRNPKMVPLCLPCYAAERLNPLRDRDCEATDEGGIGSERMTVAQMREALITQGFEISGDPSSLEIEELHKEYCAKKCLCALRDNNDATTVPFPILPAKYVDKIAREKERRVQEAERDGPSQAAGQAQQDEEYIFHFSFSEGGQFLNHPSLRPHMLPKILNLFATFLVYAADKEKSRHTSFDHKIYDALPTVFVDYANGSRNDSGFRLLRRCGRHTMDTKANNLAETDAIFLWHDNEPCILLNNVVPASMKNAEYDSYGAFTSSKIVACKCSCHCGAEGDEAVVCVHILPLALQLSMLLVEGLAEHMLLELSSRFASIDEQIFSEMEVKLTKTSIFILMLAAGQRGNLVTEQGQHDKMTIKDILSSFSVGTENSKKRKAGPPDPTKIGAVKDLSLISLASVENKISKMMNHVAQAQRGKTRKKRQRIHPDTTGKRKRSKRGGQQDRRSPAQARAVPEVITLQKDNGCYENVPCGCCDSGMLTRHRCREPVPGSGVIDPELGHICGTPFCIRCQLSWGSEDRTKCQMHLPGAGGGTGNQSPERSRPTNEESDSDEVLESDEEDEVESNMGEEPPESDEDPMESHMEESVGNGDGEKSSADYLQVSLLLESMGGAFNPDDERSVGLKLVSRRARVCQTNFVSKFGSRALFTKQQKAEADWKRLLALASSRVLPKGTPRGKKLVSISTTSSQSSALSTIDENEVVETESISRDYSCKIATTPSNHQQRPRRVRYSACLATTPETSSNLSSGTPLTLSAHRPRPTSSALRLPSMTKNLSTSRRRIFEPSHPQPNNRQRKHPRQPLCTIAPTLSNRAKKKIANRYCCFVGCKNRDDNPNLTFHRIQVELKPPPPDDARSNKWETYSLKKTKRSAQIKACGIRPAEAKKDMRICSEHEWEEKTFKNVTYKVPSTGIEYKHSFSCTLPKPIGVKARPSVMSRGLGIDRRMLSLIEETRENSEEHSQQDAGDSQGSDAAAWALVAQTAFERATPTKHTRPVAGALGQVCGLSPRSRNVVDLGGSFQRYKFSHTRIKHEKEDSILPTHFRQPDVKPTGKTNGTKSFDKEVKRRTGFASERELLAFVIIVCDGDVDLIKKTNSTLTWFEEWYFYLEMLRGKSIRSWEDAASMKGGFGIASKSLRRVFDKKMQLVKLCMNRWEKFATQEEDKAMCNPKYKMPYEGHRVIFWDMTNLQIPQPSDAELQRLTFSSYYGMNCFKGGIGLQLCGWVTTHDLWVGCVSDTKYQEESGIFLAQKEYAEADVVDGKVLPFTNVFDKGYRNRLAAWRTGNQLTLQPEFARSDRKFGRNATLTSAKIAADRSGNERAVRLTKLSDYVKRGLSNRQEFRRLDDAWLVWGFQVNFMYKEVL